MKFVSIGPRVAELRRRLNLTQEELAERAHISRLSIVHFESGKGARQDSVRRLARALNCTPEYLMGYTDSPRQPRHANMHAVNRLQSAASLQARHHAGCKAADRQLLGRAVKGHPNVFTDSDAACLAAIREEIESANKSVFILIDSDANLHFGIEADTKIAQRMAAHPEQLVGSYGKTAGSLQIAQDIHERKGELLRYGLEVAGDRRKR